MTVDLVQLRKSTGMLGVKKHGKTQIGSTMVMVMKLISIPMLDSSTRVEKVIKSVFVFVLLCSDGSVREGKSAKL